MVEREANGIYRQTDWVCMAALASYCVVLLDQYHTASVFSALKWDKDIREASVCDDY